MLNFNRKILIKLYKCQNVDGTCLLYEYTFIRLHSLCISTHG